MLVVYVMSVVARNRGRRVEKMRRRKLTSRLCLLPTLIYGKPDLKL